MVGAWLPEASGADGKGRGWTAHSDRTQVTADLLGQQDQAACRWSHKHPEFTDLRGVMSHEAVTSGGQRAHFLGALSSVEPARCLPRKNRRLP